MADATIHHPKGDYVIRRRGNAIELTRELKASGGMTEMTVGAPIRVARTKVVNPARDPRRPELSILSYRPPTANGWTSRSNYW